MSFIYQTYTTHTDRYIYIHKSVAIAVAVCKLDASSAAAAGQDFFCRQQSKSNDNNNNNNSGQNNLFFVVVFVARSY